MRTLRTLGDLLTGGDLFHLALLLSLLRVDLQTRLENDYRIRNRLNPISQKVIDDLGDLGRFSLDDRTHVGMAFDRIEIAAYMMNTMTEYPEDPEDQLPFLGQEQEDLDSGISDVGQLSDTDTETDGSCSPTAEDYHDGVPSPSSVVTSQVWTTQDPLTDRLDWNEIETVAHLGGGNVDNDDDNAAFRYEDEVSMDVDFLDDPKAYQPDEEDVENQLIEIDNRLITLDGSIQNLNDGVRHMGEQLATAHTESDVESFLLGTFDADESGHDLVSIGAVGTDADFPIFNAWDVDDTMDGMFSPSDALAKVDVQIKEEPEDTYEDVEFDQQVLSVEINEDVKDEDEENDDCSFYNHSVKDEDSESGSWSVSGASHLEDHTYAAPTYYEHSKYESSLDSFGAAARPMDDSPFSSASFQFFHRSRETRDERKARQLGIPFSISEIIDSPMEEFNAMMMQTTLTEEQITLCRDIRRRGKNKVAAQNCRRRKLNLISSLEDEVSRARTYKQQLVAERDELYRLRSEWSEKLRHLEEAVLRGLNKDVEEYSLQLAQDGRGEVRVTQRHSTRVAKLTRA